MPLLTCLLDYHLVVTPSESETAPLLQPKVEHVDFTDAQALNDSPTDSDDVIQLKRSFHGIRSGLLSGNEEDRYSSTN